MEQFVIYNGRIYHIEAIECYLEGLRSEFELLRRTNRIGPSIIAIMDEHNEMLEAAERSAIYNYRVYPSHE